MLRTPAGFRHRVSHSTHPVDEHFAEVDLADGFQFSATEFVDAVTELRRRDADRPFDPALLWEADPSLGFDLADELDREVA